jgi:hypothetical protein
MGYIENAHKIAVGKFVRMVTFWKNSLRLNGWYEIVIIEGGGKRGGINFCI